MTHNRGLFPSAVCGKACPFQLARTTTTVGCSRRLAFNRQHAPLQRGAVRRMAAKALAVRMITRFLRMLSCVGGGGTGSEPNEEYLVLFFLLSEPVVSEAHPSQMSTAVRPIDRPKAAHKQDSLDPANACRHTTRAAGAGSLPGFSNSVTNASSSSVFRSSSLFSVCRQRCTPA